MTAGPHVAFYKGKGSWEDWLIRFVTRSNYSHCEYVHSLNCIDGTGRVECWSSSGRDGGVRKTFVDLNSGNWDVVPVLWISDDRRNFFEELDGLKYDWLGLLLSQFFAFRRHSQKRWFCSEICATVLDFAIPQAMAPGDLYKNLLAANNLYQKGLNGNHATA